MEENYIKLVPENYLLDHIQLVDKEVRVQMRLYSQLDLLQVLE